MVYYLTIVGDNPDDAEEHRLEADVIIVGRFIQNDIVLRNHASSIRQMRLVREGDTYRLFDVVTTHGTFVNGVYADDDTGILLRPGDVITVGKNYITLHFSDRPRSASAVDQSSS
jgi:pSer/pThr/pTyr-binding forkhead associated (FHA) protein